jgi:hypothetical protein
VGGALALHDASCAGAQQDARPGAADVAHSLSDISGPSAHRQHARRWTRSLATSAAAATVSAVRHAAAAVRSDAGPVPPPPPTTRVPWLSQNALVAIAVAFGLGALLLLRRR